MRYLLILLLAGCTSTTETDTDADGAICLGLCYLIRITHDQEVTTEEIEDD
jgi:hypothetical protein